MNYYKIGQRIRTLRKAQGLSQEQLAERIGISVTHMSHTETGNTKLSLPVFVCIADVLGVPTDDLLHDPPTSQSTSIHEIDKLLAHCSPQQVRIISDIVRAARISLNKHMHH